MRLTRDIRFFARRFLALFSAVGACGFAYHQFHQPPPVCLGRETPPLNRAQALSEPPPPLNPPGPFEVSFAGASAAKWKKHVKALRRKLRCVEFVGYDLRGAQLREVEHSDASFLKCALGGLDLSASKLVDVLFKGCSAEGLRLTGGELRNTVFEVWDAVLLVFERE